MVLSSSAPPNGLRSVGSPVTGLAVFERRVPEPRATIVCVHGGLDRAGSFARLARRLEHFDIVAYDRRGYQGSRQLGPSNFGQHVEDLVALARRESSPVMVFGHSFGGLVALGAARADPDHVCQLVVYEAPLNWVLERDGVPPSIGVDPAKEAELFFKRMVSPAVWERLSPAERESRRLDGPALVADLAIVRSEIPFDVASIRVPTLYAYGEWERTPYYRSLTERLAELNPLIEGVALAAARHGAHLSHPDLVSELLDQAWGSPCASA